jgi:negative regulator of sigma-B (phosphoserine phosphatase)
METMNQGAVEWGIAGSVSPGQSQSGDRHVVCPFPDGFLMAVLDGLGHGNGAALAAARAVRVLEEGAHEPIIALMRRCHEELRATRGAVMSVASFNISYGLMTWLGVGNVQGILRHSGTQSLKPPEVLLLRAGVVGMFLPPLGAAVLPVLPGDILIFATDGVREDFAQSSLESDTPQKAAEEILSQFGKGNDDALVLVARFLENRT